MSTVPASKEYLALIRRFPLRPIRDDEMLETASNLFSELVLKAQNRTPDESDYLSPPPRKMQAAVLIPTQSSRPLSRR